MEELGTFTAHRSSLVVQASTLDGHDVLHLSGQLDQHTSRWFGQQALAHAGLRRILIALDLGALDLLDSAGIRSLALLHRALTERGSSLTFVTASAHLRKLFRISGLAQLVPIHDRLDQVGGEVGGEDGNGDGNGGDNGGEPASAG